MARKPATTTTSASAPNSTNAWHSGTDLRNEDGIYRWPHLSFEEPEPQFYPSVTTVLDNLASGMRFAVAWFQAEYTQELARAAKNKEPIRVWIDDNSPQGGRMVEVRAIDILTNNMEQYGKNWAMHWLKLSGERELTRRANRGSTVHDCIEDWCYGIRFPESDLGDYLQGILSARGYSIGVDYVYPYAKKALEWLENHIDEVRQAESVVMDDEWVYAGCEDMEATLRNFPDIPRNEWWMIDAKCSKADQPPHELQQAAYFFAEFVGIRGTNQRVAKPRCTAAANLYIQPESARLRRWPRIEWGDDAGIKDWKREDNIPFRSFLNARQVWQTLATVEHPTTVKAPKILIPKADDLRLFQ